MKKVTSIHIGRYLCLVLMEFTILRALASIIPIAGIYEMDAHPDFSKHQMYLELDFINGRPDFTQTFTEKKADFMLLPADFMNAKKLKTAFQGTTAPGFGKYRQKTLLSSTEEFRITNPRLKKGIVLVDWENTDGVKGEAIIIPQADGSLISYGLTSFDRLLSPDGYKLQLVKSLLPETGKHDDGNEKEKPDTIVIDSELVEEIKIICTGPGGVPEAVKRLKEMPDDNDAPAPAQAPDASAKPEESGKSVAPVSLSGKKNDVFNIFISNDGSIWRASSTLAKLGMGQNGIMEASATFADGGDSTVVMHIKQQIAPGDCKVHCFEYYYYGKTVGNTVVFDRIKITKRDNRDVPNPKSQSIPKNEPNVIRLLDPATFDFSGLKFTKTK